MIPFSVLDLSPINQGSDAAHAFRNSLDLAQHAERWNYKRFWLAEHHNMPGIASAATAVVIGYIAGGTKTIRVGSGGIMLPNHAPLVIAEQFGTLESLYGGRIDLGLGRAPGTDQRTARALISRRPPIFFPRMSWNCKPCWDRCSPTRRCGGAWCGIKSPDLAARIEHVQRAIRCHARFAVCVRIAFCSCGADAGAQCVPQPVSAVGAASGTLRHDWRKCFRRGYGSEARRLITSLQQQFVSLRRGTPGPLPPPVDNMNDHWSPMEWAGVEQALAYSVVGATDTVRRGLEAFIAETHADELMLTAQIYDHAARLRSFEIAAEMRDRVAAPPKAVSIARLKNLVSAGARQPTSLARSDISIA